MKHIVIELVAAGIVFLMFKCILVAVSKALEMNKERTKKFDIFLSIIVQLFFILVWVASLHSMNKRFILSDIECYISLWLIGFFCVIWCYFSWDIDRIFVKPRKAKAEERRKKKILIYLLILIFVIMQGYYQTLHAIGIKTSEEIYTLFSVTNYSIVVGVIALDRLLNQIFSK